MRFQTYKVYQVRNQRLFMPQYDEGVRYLRWMEGRFPGLCYGIHPGEMYFTTDGEFPAAAMHVMNTISAKHFGFVFGKNADDLREYKQFCKQ